MTLHDPTSLCEKEYPESTVRKAQTFSTFTQPPIISVPVFLLLCTECGDITDYAVCAVLCILFTVVLPMAAIIYYSKKFGNTDGDIAKREDRYVVLVIGIVFYVAGTLLLWLYGAPDVIMALMVAYALCTFAVLLITFRWKISLHAMGLVGPSMALAYAFGPAGLLLLLLLPPVAWCRYVLRKHTPAQLVGGASLGFVLTAMVFLLML